jgi:hypothetical protein
MKRIAPLVMMAAALAGCGEPILRTTPDWDARFGVATRTAFARQVINPAGAADTRPADGADGAAVLAAEQRYQKSFAEPPVAAQGAFTIGVSGGK